MIELVRYTVCNVLLNRPQVGGQEVSVLSPHDVDIMRLKTPDENPDVAGSRFASKFAGKKRSNIKHRTFYRQPRRVNRFWRG